MASENVSIVWSDKNASVQLLLSGKYRAINYQSLPKVFSSFKEAVSYAGNKVPIGVKSE